MILEMSVVVVLFILPLVECSCTTPTIYNSTVIQLGNCNNDVYTVTLLMGTPSHQFVFQLDTGSNIMWIPNNLISNPGFNSATSSTFKTTNLSGTITYADQSSVTGTYATDIVSCFTPTNISSLTSFLLVSKETPSFGFFPIGVQGLVGMGNVDVPNFIDLAYGGREIGSNVFSLQLRALPQPSYMYYNRLPYSLLSSTYYAGVYGEGVWMLRVLRFTAGSTDLTAEAARGAIIDSGTTLFYFNAQLYSKIIELYFASCIQKQVCNCNAPYPTFSFVFMGVQVSIPSTAYMSPVAGGCTYNFNTLSTVSSILLGDTLFKQYIVTFDKSNQVIGFAGSTAVPIYRLFQGIVFQFVMLGIIIMVGLVGAVMLFTYQRKRKEGLVMEMDNTNKEIVMAREKY